MAFGEEGRVWRKRSGSPLVYEHFLKCRTLYVNFDRHTHAQARNEAEQALAINSTYSPALFLLGFILTDQVRLVRSTRRRPMKLQWNVPPAIWPPTRTVIWRTKPWLTLGYFSAAMMRRCLLESDALSPIARTPTISPE